MRRLPRPLTPLQRHQRAIATLVGVARAKFGGRGYSLSLFTLGVPVDKKVRRLDREPRS